MSSHFELFGLTPAFALEAEPLVVDEAAIGEQAPAGIRYGELPGWLGDGGVRELERALKARLPDKLTLAVFRDPVSGETSRPGEAREAFVARLAADGGGEKARSLAQKLERKRQDLAVRQQEVEGRRQEKWLAVGTAVLKNIGLLMGKRRAVTATSLARSRWRWRPPRASTTARATVCPRASSSRSRPATKTPRSGASGPGYICETRRMRIASPHPDAATDGRRRWVTVRDA